MEPLGISATGTSYGEKIELVPVGGGAPCAAIVRMILEAGSRLVVTSLSWTPARVAVVKGNRAAQTAAAKACGGQRAEVDSPSGKAVPIAHEAIGIDDPLAQKLWATSMSAVKAAGGNVEVYVAAIALGINSADGS